MPFQQYRSNEIEENIQRKKRKEFMKDGSSVFKSVNDISLTGYTASKEISKFDYERSVNREFGRRR